MEKDMKVFLIALIFFTIDFSIAREQSEAFQVKIFDQRVKVISPNKHSQKMSIILENVTLTKFIGKIVTQKRKVLEYLAIPPRGFQTIEISIKKNEVVFFVPQSPGLQEVELVVGRDSYEIPSKK